MKAVVVPGVHVMMVTFQCEGCSGTMCTSNDVNLSV